MVTVIMPVRHEVSFIARSVGAVLAQDYPADRLEILVADGRSTDGTREVLRSLQDRHPHLRVVDNPSLIVPTGLNAALREARGDIIVRVDGHTEVAPDYVRQCVAALRSSGADNVGGRMIAVGEGAFGEAVALATSTPFGVGNARFHYSDRDEWVDTVYMGAWPRTVFDRLGFFNEAAERNEDDEFNYRLLAKGGGIWLSQSIRSRYTPRGTPRALWKQYFHYGCWKVWVAQQHLAQMRVRQFVPAAFVAVLVGSAFLGIFSTWARATLAITAAGYMLANLMASVVTARRQGWRHLRHPPYVLFILHMSYGTGFLVGLARFWRFWKVG